KAAVDRGKRSMEIPRFSYSTAGLCQPGRPDARRAALPDRPSEIVSVETGSARIEFDDEVRFHLHRIGHFVERRDADEGRLGAVDGEIFGQVALGQALR